MRAGFSIAVLAACLASAPAAGQDWTHAERVENYAISGKTGIALYESIGGRGPKTSLGRAIAYTTFDLKWSRNYVPEGETCRLASARPHLTIIYKLPKPSGPLPEPTKRLWRRFIDGIAAHERVHGEIILDMVKAMEAETVGLTATGDPGCKKIRADVLAKVQALSVKQRERGRDFDKVEMSKAGNVHQLILGLVNGW
jgi:predicted secreted Zn-dependent protease